MNRYPVIPTVLVVTEGLTEKIYLDRFRERDAGFNLM